MLEPGSILPVVTLGVVVAAGACVLYATATAIRNGTSSHDLRVKVANLRVNYYKRLRRDQGCEEVIEVDVVDAEPEGTAPPHSPQNAA